MKKINIITIALLAYLLVMSVIGWPGRNESLSYTKYFIVIGVSVAAIFLLRFMRIKIYNMRNKQKDEKKI